jgi:hypothetical protein
MLAGRRSVDMNLIDKHSFNPLLSIPLFLTVEKFIFWRCSPRKNIAPRIKTSGGKIQSNPCGALMLPKQQDALGIGMQVAVCRKRRYHNPDGQAITNISCDLFCRCVIADVCLS